MRGATLVLVLAVATLAVVAGAQAQGTAPCAPTGVAAVPVGSVVQLSWDEVAAADSYEVWRAAAGGEPTLAIVEQAPSNGTIDTQVEQGVEYTYTVAAVVAGQALEPCGPVTAVASGPCAPELSVVAEQRGNLLTWTQVTVAQGYVIRRAEGDGAATVLASPDASTSSYVDEDVAAGIVYHYSVHAVVDGNERPPCAIVAATGIPEFPTTVALGAAAALGAGAYFLARKQ